MYFVRMSNPTRFMTSLDMIEDMMTWKELDAEIIAAMEPLHTILKNQSQRATASEVVSEKTTLQGLMSKDEGDEKEQGVEGEGSSQA